MRSHLFADPPPDFVPIPLRRSVVNVVGGVWGDEPNGLDDVPCIRVADFDRGRHVVNTPIPTLRAVPRSQRSAREVHCGDMLLEKSGGGDRQPVGAVVRYTTEEHVVCSNFIARLRPAAGFDSGFLTYLHAALYSSGVAGLSIKQTTGIQNMDVGHYLRTVVPVPRYRVQRAIANFLDREIQRIDALIEKKQRLRGRLTERRLAVLLYAVDGRLTVAGSPRSARPLPWLDSLPVDWPTIKLSFVARLGSGHTPSRTHPEYWTDCTIPWITTGEVAQVRDDRREVITQTRERISELGLANSAAELHPAGTVVLCRTASAGYSAIMGSDMATSQDFATWTCSPRLLPRFLLTCLRAMRSDLLGRLAMGSTHKTIYMPDIQALRIPLPPVKGQQAALDAADRELRAIDPLRQSLDAQIRLLYERRQALITEVVTGQRRIDEPTPAVA